MYTHLVLKNNIALAKKGTHLVDLDLNNPITIILGPNGHGKSTILKEINPLPPDNSMYSEGGYKLIERVENNVHYRMESFTGKHSTHSFKVNGVEKNTGGTQAVQKELCKYYFNLTERSVRYMSGLKTADLFTNLSTGSRKELLMDLYPNDTSYALGVFKKLCTGLRETDGAIKNQVKRLTEEQEKMSQIQGMSEEELEQKITYLEFELKEALLLQGMVSGSLNLNGQLQEKMDKLNRLTASLLTYNFKKIQYSRTELLTEIEKKNKSMDIHLLRKAVLEQKVNDIAESLSGIDIKQQNPQLFQVNIDMLINERTELVERKALLTEKYDRLPFFNDTELDKSGLAEITDEFLSALNHVVVCSNPSLTHGGYRELVAKQDETTSVIRNLEMTLNNNLHKVKHFEHASGVECPECKTTFKPGFDAKDIERVKRDISKLNDDIRVHKEQLNTLTKAVEGDAEWFSGLNYVLAFMRNNSNVKCLVEVIKEFDVGKVSPDTLHNALKTHQELFFLNRREIALGEELNVLQTRLDLLRNNDIESVWKMHTEYEELLGNCIYTIRYTQREIEGLTQRLDELNSYDFTLEVIGNLKEEILNGLQEQGRYDLKVRMSDVIARLAPEKDRMVANLIRAKSSSSVIASIEENIDNLKHRSKKLKMLIDGLCPNKGFIGRLMSEFIQTITSNSNAHIRDVWTFPLYMKPCNKENGDLNYLFPLINGYDDSAAKDVSDGSGGEGELINAVLRIIQLAYRKNPLPLFLDEVGVNLDETHRLRFYDFVKRLSESGRIPQMFIISHYASQYGLFNDASFITIGGQVKSGYNKGCIIK